MVDSTENGLRQATISIGKDTPNQCQKGFYKTHTTGKIIAKRRKSTKPEMGWAIRQNRPGEGKLTKKGGYL